MDGFTLIPELTFLLGVAVFWVILYVLARVFHLEKHGLDAQPAYFMYRSKALNSFLDRVANKRRTLWIVLSNIGVAFSVGLMVFSIYLLANNVLRFVFPSIGPVAPIFPAVPVLFIRLYWMPYFVFAVAVIALSHELAHGIIMRLEGIPVLSTGVAAFLVFLSFFVEPDEKEFEKASLPSKLKMLAVGSSTNLVTSLLVTLLIMGLFVPAPAGVLIQEVVPDGPLDRAGLQQWDVIQAINGTLLYVNTDYSDYMSNVKPNTTLVVTVLHANRMENISVTTIASSSNSSRAALGFFSSFVPYRKNILGLDHYTGINLFWTLFWIYFLGLGFAVVNMFPAFLFDGEKVLYYSLATLVKKRKRELRWALNILGWGLLGLNFALSFLLYGFFRI